MSNTLLTADIIAQEAVMQLDNNLVMAKQVYRGYEADFAKKVNQYDVGESVSIKRPMDFTVRDGRVMNLQDTTEGKFTMTVDQFKGVDFSFTSQDLTQKISVLSERVIKPAMIQLANDVDAALMAQYVNVSKWVGTPGETINSFADFSKGPESLDNAAVPLDGRGAVLAPADHWGLLGSQTALLNNQLVGTAYTRGSLGSIGGVETFMSQNVPTHTVGSDVTTVTVNQSVTTSTTTYAATKDSNQQTMTIAGGTLNAGDVFTIADVNAVNPVTKADLGFLKQFTVVSYSSNTLVFSPALIWTGAHQTGAIASGTTDLNTNALVFKGTASTGYTQNMMFCKNAFALAMVPLVDPPGAVEVARKTYKGLSVRCIPVYDGINDVSKWRLDILYGVKTIDERQAVRVSGTG